MDKITRMVDEKGIVTYRNQEGKLHRLDGPSIIYPNGTEYWCNHGEYYRSNGPYRIWPDGRYKIRPDGRTTRWKGDMIEE